MKGETRTPNRSPRVTMAFLLALNITGTVAFSQTRAPASEAEEDLWFPPTCILLRITDPEGQPVAGAKAGPAAALRQYASEDFLRWVHAGLSDETGRVALDLRTICLPKPNPGPDAVYVLHKGRRLGGLVAVTKADAGQTVDVQLHRVCRVNVAFSSASLEKLGMPLNQAQFRVYWQDCPVLPHYHDGQDPDLLLPPGDYRLEIHGDGQNDTQQGVMARARVESVPFTIIEGQRQCDLGTIELGPSKLATLIGRAAPRLGAKLAWVNGDPVQLAQLRGRAVALYFGGRYPTASRDITQLLKLQQAFGDKELTIIAIYDCASKEEFEQRWTRAYMPRQLHEMPLRIAIDSRSDGRSADCVCERYGLEPLWPGAVLIDAAGNVAGEMKLGYGGGIIVEVLKNTIQQAAGR